MPVLRSWTDDDLILAFKKSESIAQVIKILNLAVSGGTYENIKKHLNRLNLLFKHDAATRKLLGIKKHQYRNSYKNSDIFIQNSRASQGTLRRRYLETRSEIFCDICGICNWNYKSLLFQVDHINGIRNDNRKQNLRLMCPNCHSQTDTFGGKNKNKNIAPK